MTKEIPGQRPISQEAFALMHSFIGARREARLPISGAHDESHLRAVATDARTVGEIYGFDAKTLELCEVAGLFHDILRDPSEKKSAKGVGADEVQSAMVAVTATHAINAGGMRINPQEQRAVAWAIENQGKAPQIFGSDETKEDVPTTLPEQVQLALYVADKLQANGAEVIARRPHFVAGERLQSEDGDLRRMGFDPEKDRLKVVAIESLLRLAYVNQEGQYPKKLEELVQTKYEAQRQFVRGVIKAGGFSMQELARELVTPREAYNGNTMLQNKGFEPGVDTLNTKFDLDALTDLTTYIEMRSGIHQSDVFDDTVTPEDDVLGAVEIVDHYSSRWEESVSTVTASFEPQNAKAKSWLNK